MLRFIPMSLWFAIAFTCVGCSGASKIDVARLITSG